MSSAKPRPPEDRFEDLKEEVKEAEQGDDLHKALEKWRELGRLAHWFVEEKSDTEKEAVREECRRRVRKLERRQQELKESEQSTVPEESDDESWREQEEDESFEEKPRERSSEAEDSSDIFEVVDVEHDFGGVGGMEEEKEKLNRKVKFPFENPEKFENVGVSGLVGAVLWGPPGTGKTFICEALANEVNASFLKVRGGDIVDKFVGEPQKNVKRLFNKAIEYEPCIIFLDEVDALLSERGRTNNPTGHDQMVSEFLSRMSDMKDRQVLVVGATNKPWVLDEAATRNGRFTETIYMGVPDKATRIQVIRKQLNGRETDSSVSPSLVHTLAEKTAGYSCADLEAILDAAGYYAVYDNGRDYITAEDIRFGFSETDSSISKKRWEPFENGKVDPFE